jgi:hypothetical protein
MTLAILERSKNSGIIVVKKENGGGITGYGDLGLIRLSTDTGRLTGDDANFLGGIAGNYKGTIAECSSLSVISGNKYIGGIAGQARRVRNCYSMAAITGGNGWQGAVIGNVTSESREEDYSVIHGSLMDSVYHNYYVSDTLYGINGISYQGVAQGITYGELMETEGIPEEFASLTVTFLNEEDEVIRRQKVKYGDDLGEISYPYTETEEGQYVQWIGFYSKTATGNVFLTASAEEELITLASAAKDFGRSLGYVSGSFTELSEFSIEEVTDNFLIETDENVTEHVYAVSLRNTSVSEDTLTKIRILKKDTDGETEVYIRSADGWQKADFREIGSYIETDFAGTDAMIRIKTTENKNRFLRFWLQKLKKLSI